MHDMELLSYTFRHRTSPPPRPNCTCMSYVHTLNDLLGCHGTATKVKDILFLLAFPHLKYVYVLLAIKTRGLRTVIATSVRKRTIKLAFDKPYELAPVIQMHQELLVVMACMLAQRLA